MAQERNQKGYKTWSVKQQTGYCGTNVQLGYYIGTPTLPGSPGCQSLLKEVDCDIVVNLLFDQKNSHFVARDGKLIHGNPCCLKIRRMDQTSSKTSEAVFSKLCHDCEEWDIPALYRFSAVLTGEGSGFK